MSAERAQHWDRQSRLSQRDGWVAQATQFAASNAVFGVDASWPTRFADDTASLWVTARADGTSFDKNCAEPNYLMVYGNV